MNGSLQQPTTPAKNLEDFPDFLGAVLVKELRQGIRGKMFVVPFFGIHVAMLLALILDFSLFESNPGRSEFFRINGLPAQKSFWQFALIVLTIGMPLSGMSALSRERHGKAGELLLMTGVSRWKIMLGKWSALCALSALTTTTMLPYLLARYFLGGMNVPLTIAFLIGILMLNATANALAVGLSGYKNIGIRLISTVSCLASFFCSCLICIGSTAMISQHFISSDSARFIGGFFGFTATCFLFSSMGLQLGRLLIRPYERPFESDTSGGVIALAILSPLILGFGAVLTLGFGAAIIALLFAWAILAMDRTPPPRRSFPKPNSLPSPPSA